MSLIEDLLKSATGLLTTGGGAGDLSGEAQAPQNVGQPIQSGVFQGPTPKVRSNMPFGNTGTFVPNANYANYGISNNQLQNKDQQPQNKDQQPQTKKPENALSTIATNPNLFQRIFKMTPGEASERWKDKGGFEGLMSNPAFSLGLAMMQSGAKGEGISKSMFDNALKAGQISSAYKDRIAASREEPFEATVEQIENTKQLLRTLDVEEPNFFERAIGKVFKGQNKQAQYEEAAETITIALEKEMSKIRKNNPKRDIVFDTAYKLRIIKGLVKEGKIKKVGGIPFITKGTIVQERIDPFKKDKPKRAEGGPVKANKEYIVGEKGPEMFVPQLDGNIINNDDAKVVNMLLESNPQLKTISRARAVKILKNRFPDYF